MVQTVFSVAQVASVLAAASALRRYPRSMRQLDKYRLRGYGVNFDAARHLQDLVSANVFVSVGVTGIQLLRPDVPLWASHFVPYATILIILGYTVVMLVPRKHFHADKFFGVVLAPVFASIAPSMQSTLTMLASIDPSTIPP